MAKGLSRGTKGATTQTRAAEQARKEADYLRRCNAVQQQIKQRAAALIRSVANTETRLLDLAVEVGRRQNMLLVNRDEYITLNNENRALRSKVDALNRENAELTKARNEAQSFA